jgi:hypothetical protein
VAVEVFVKPLDERVRSMKAGRVLSYCEQYPLTCHIELDVKNSAAM